MDNHERKTAERRGSTQQQKFADLVQKVERLKEKQQESEKELSNMFNSLMQKAFRGDIYN